MAAKMKKGPIQRFLRLIYDNSINHLIENPARFWRESGYNSRKCAQSVVYLLNRRGWLEKRPGENSIYMVLYALPEEGSAIKANADDIPAFKKQAQEKNSLETGAVKGKVTKAFLCILAEFAESGIIKSPSRFWHEAGFQDRESAQGTTSYLSRNGYLEKVENFRATYKLLYKITTEGIVRLPPSELYPEEPNLCSEGDKAEITVLALTLEEKEVFDMLGSPEAASAVQLYEDRPEELRINELKSPLNLLEADEKDRLITKLCRCNILDFAGTTNANCGSESGRSRIYKFDRQAYAEFREKIVIMGELEELLENYSDQLCRFKNSLNALNERRKAAKEEYSTVSGAEMRLVNEINELDTRLKQHLLRKSELETEIEEISEELGEAGQAEKIADLENTILILQSLIKLPLGKRVALAKKIFSKE
jgi:hypothetical protein